MPSINCIVQTKISTSMRSRQVQAMFDAPADEKCKIEWNISAPFEDKKWNIGLIVGPSGSGKTTIASDLFGDLVDKKLEWGGPSMIDDFNEDLSVELLDLILYRLG